MHYAAILIASMTLAVAADSSPAPETANRYAGIVPRVGDFLLGLQGSSGAIADSPGSATANEDSNMEYALMGLAAAYGHSKDRRYLLGLEKGIAWLADRQEMSDPRWRGSWFYAYRTTPPFSPVAISPGGRVSDVRGVDATCALFPYLLYLHSTLSGQTTLAERYRANATAALDFLLVRNRLPNGFFASSWQRKGRSGRKVPGAEDWQLYSYQYTADQADDYLGLRAGAVLYKEPKYDEASRFLKEHLAETFFDRKQQKYAVGREASGNLDHDPNDFDGIFPQGYVPWALGAGVQNRAAFDWLKAHRQEDGSLSCYSNGKDPRYSLSVAIYALAAHSLGPATPIQSLDWLVSRNYDAKDGGIRDTLAGHSAKYANVAGFVLMGLLGFPAFPKE